jgi:cytochrome c peroxidase
MTNRCAPDISAFKNLICKIAANATMLFTIAFISNASASDTAVISGKKLVANAKCEACHASKFGGDGSQIYLRKDRRVTALSKLQPQVARCNTDLNLGLFPDDEAAIATYLNATFYKFKN